MQRHSGGHARFFGQRLHCAYFALDPLFLNVSLEPSTVPHDVLETMPLKIPGQPSFKTAKAPHDGSRAPRSPPLGI